MISISNTRSEIIRLAKKTDSNVNSTSNVAHQSNNSVNPNSSVSYLNLNNSASNTNSNISSIKNNDKDEPIIYDSVYVSTSAEKLVEAGKQFNASMFPFETKIVVDDKGFYEFT